VFILRRQFAAGIENGGGDDDDSPNTATRSNNTIAQSGKG
jgi:hypothetical protein